MDELLKKIELEKKKISFALQGKNPHLIFFTEFFCANSTSWPARGRFTKKMQQFDENFRAGIDRAARSLL